MHRTLVLRREGDGPWIAEYRLDPNPRRLDEFEEPLEGEAAWAEALRAHFGIERRGAGA